MIGLMRTKVPLAYTLAGFASNHGLREQEMLSSGWEHAQALRYGAMGPISSTPRFRGQVAMI